MSLGIPGDNLDGDVLGGLLLHGLAPGPPVRQNGPFVYGVFIAFCCHHRMVVLEFAGLKFFVSVLKVPRHILLPIRHGPLRRPRVRPQQRDFRCRGHASFRHHRHALITYKFRPAPMILGFVLGQ
jgi:putative tricarboxylic transport membrane protein